MIVRPRAARATRAARAAALLLSLTVLAACDRDPTRPANGTLRLQVVTTGTPTVRAWTLLIGADTMATLAPNDTVELSLPPGGYHPLLHGVPIEGAEANRCSWRQNAPAPSTDGAGLVVHSNHTTLWDIATTCTAPAP